ncbi:hypothetical protein MKEN_00439800 [Mycena kentingensis (nom. inval.)]|nr:hypothetical protein MKEN_00439800 [Mycena kentingensis (nom. inval.)]
MSLDDGAVAKAACSWRIQITYRIAPFDTTARGEYYDRLDRAHTRASMSVYSASVSPDARLSTMFVKDGCLSSSIFAPQFRLYLSQLESTSERMKWSPSTSLS